MSNFDNMGKEELRAACKAAQVKGWGKMNNTQMRDALKAGQAAMGIPETVKQTEAPVNEPAPAAEPAPVAEVAAAPEQLPKEDSKREPTPEYLATLGPNGIDGICPHCGAHESNGFADHQHIADANPAGARTMVREYICLGCGKEWGPEIVREVRKPVMNPTGVKIQKNREERNGVKRPSVGTICHAIWASLDAHLATYKTTPSFKDLKALQDQYGWQRNTAVTQYQRWKEFNDLMVR